MRQPTPRLRSSTKPPRGSPFYDHGHKEPSTMNGHLRRSDPPSERVTIPNGIQLTREDLTMKAVRGRLYACLVGNEIANAAKKVEKYQGFTLPTPHEFARPSRAQIGKIHVQVCTNGVPEDAEIESTPPPLPDVIEGPDDTLQLLGTEERQTMLPDNPFSHSS